MISISGDNISFRTLTYEDHVFVHRWKNDDDLNHDLLAHPLPFTTEMAVEWIKRNGEDKNQVLFSIVEPGDSKKPIGIIRLMFIDWINRNTELGIFIGDKDARNKGLGKEIMGLIMQYAFNDLNLNRIFLRVAADNFPAIKLYEKVGFQKEGVFRQQVWRKGQFSDVVLMGILKSEYTK